MRRVPVLLFPPKRDYVPYLAIDIILFSSDKIQIITYCAILYFCTEIKNRQTFIRVNKKIVIPLIILGILASAFFVANYLTDFSLFQKEKKNQYISHHLSDNKLVIKTSLGSISVSFINSSIVQVSFAQKKSDQEVTSHSVVLSADKTGGALFEDENELFYTRDKLQVVIKKSPFKLIFFQKGNQILAESDGYFKSNEVEGFRFSLKPDEKIYGAGFRTTPLNRRGHRYELYNQAVYGYNLNSPNLNFSVPFIISSKGYGLLFDNASKGWLDLDVHQNNVMEFSSIGGEMSYYVIADNDFDSILKEYGRLTGYQPMPPRWALGNLQSKFGYKTQHETEAIVDQMIEAGYPLDAIIIDLYWFGLGFHDHFYMGNLDWYKKNWPEPEQMIQRFKQRGIKTILITEPFILQESKNWQLASDNKYMGTDNNGNTFVIDDLWFGPGGLIDVFNPDARRWFWEQYRRQIEIGIAGWWGDLGEPEKHPAKMQHFIGSAEVVHNLYSHYWHKMLWDYYSLEYPEVRLFNLNRSGFAGSQRYSVYPWSGDVSRDWNGFQVQPLAVLGMTLSGFSYMHSDLGGFAMGEPDEELYLRWLQYGAFNPVFRPHGDTNAPVEPIAYSDNAQKIIKEYIDLRYRMLPYNYSIAWLNSIKGTPLTKPLFFEEPDNDEISNIDDTFLWGPNLLIAPILEKDAKMRKVYLPKGKWYDFFTDQVMNGGKWIEKSTTLENIPVFARGGGFIPMINPIKNTTAYTSEILIIHHYYDPEIINSEFIIYDDDGETKSAYEKGLYELLEIKSMHFDSFVLFTFNRKEAFNYNGKPATRNIELLIHGYNSKPGKIQTGRVPVKNALSKQAYQTTKTQISFWDSEKELLQIKFQSSESITNLQIIF
jgi:oligosaccharide 4-alpha-D-glucosyltransferase